MVARARPVISAQMEGKGETCLDLEGFGTFSKAAGVCAKTQRRRRGTGPEFASNGS